MVRIAFGYKRRVGKDSSCDYLIKKYGGIKLSFAEPLYKILNFAQEVCHFKKVKDRKFLQFVGTEWARSINDNVWTNLLLSQVEGQNNQNIFVSDLRFKNEMKALKEHNFICIRIKANISEVDGYANHQSDIDLDECNEWDYTIENFESLENLYRQLDHIYTVVQKK
jgi:hypothetical protein